MKYNYQNQKKALDYLKENAPHDLEKFRKLYNVETENDEKVKMYIFDILLSDVWTTDEKIELINLYDLTNEKSFEYKNGKSDIGSLYYVEGMMPLDHCIFSNNYTGFEALIKLGVPFSAATIARIIKYIEDPKERYKYCKLLVDNYGDKENIEVYAGTGNSCYLETIPTLCDRYPIHVIAVWGESRLWRTATSMEHICATEDIELIKLFLLTIKDINKVFRFAIKTGNQKIVKMFIDAGADVNYQDEEFEFDNGKVQFLTPLKQAINNNDFEMVKFLHKNGADLNFVSNSEKIKQYVDKNSKFKTEDSHYSKEENISLMKYIMGWARPSLEFAINATSISILSDVMHISSDKNIEELYAANMQIVNYLYKNGATFNNGEMNYTDLICYAINCDDFESAEYYFKKAKEKNATLNFEKIIGFIHEPGIIKTSVSSYIHYKYYEKSSEDWYKMCAKYSKVIDVENHNNNIKLMLTKIFETRCYSSYKDLVAKFSKTLSKEVLREIPAAIHVNTDCLKEILNLGYDINTPDKKGDNLLINFMHCHDNDYQELNKLLSLGVDINYQNPETGVSALSRAIASLEMYDFGKFIKNFDYEKQKLKMKPSEYEAKSKKVIQKIISSSSEEIIKSDEVKEMVYWKIEPGYPQIIYNEILQSLVKKGFEVDDEYFRKSITFLSKTYTNEYVTEQWDYLSNLYENFNNQVIDLNYAFPHVELLDYVTYKGRKSEKLVNLIKTHLSRNFAISKEQVLNPDDIIDEGRDYRTNIKYSVTKLNKEQKALYNEIKRYIGHLDYRYILEIIDSCPILDNQVNYATMLYVALKVKDINLAKELINRGATIELYDDKGYDITSEYYDDDVFELFKQLKTDYNSNKECEDLLREIGCDIKVKTKKK